MVSQRVREHFYQAVFFVAALTAIVIVLLIFVFLLKEALPFFLKPEARTLLERRWVPVSFQRQVFGLLPLLTGTFLVTVLALVFSVPLGVLGAVYLAELAQPREREILKPFVELLAGIPSVVLGFFGLTAVGPLVKSCFGLPSGLTALTGAVLLALMAVPTIMTVAEDALNSVPAAYRHASLALGATRLQTVMRVIVPAASSGIFAGVVLGTGRVVGETMAVMMLTGNTPAVTLSPFESVRTITATIAAEMGEVVYGSVHYQALFVLGAVLMLISFFFNVAAQRILRRYRRYHVE